MTNLPNTLRSALPPVARYGAAAKFDFDNPSKWATVPSVPLLDEHEMTDESGAPVAYVDRAALEEIARNNNKRVFDTGDPATLILGHTSDDPRAPEKPAKGFVVNYKVKPFKRDESGQVIYAIHGDYKLRPRNAHLAEEFPRRSVELWWNKKELDPIAMLGGTTPERDLGAVVRKARFNAVALGSAEHRVGSGKSQQSAGDVIRFSYRGPRVVEWYSINTTQTNKTREGSPVPTPRRKYNAGCASAPHRYELGDADGDPALMDQDPELGGGEDDGGDDPLVAKVFQSKQFKALEGKLDQILAALQPEQGGDGGGMPGEEGGMPGEDGMGGEPGMGGPGGGMGGGMPPQGGGGPGMGGPPGGEDMEDREDHGEQPVRFESDGEPEDDEEETPFRKSMTGFPGPGSTNIAGMTGKRVKPTTSYSRNGNHSTNGKQPMNSTVVRLQRKLENLTIKLARQDAEKTIQQLKGEGIIFGDTPEEAAQGEADETEFLALLGDEDRAYHVNNVIRKRYKRRRHDPANPASPGIARYARQDTQAGPDDDFEPQDSQEASDLADLITVRKMGRPEAIKFMRDRRRGR